ASRLGHGVPHQLRPETLTLTGRIDGDVLDEKTVAIGAADQIAEDGLPSHDHRGIAIGDGRGIIGRHRSRLAAEPRNIFGIGRAGDVCKPRRIVRTRRPDERVAHEPTLPASAANVAAMASTIWSGVCSMVMTIEPSPAAGSSSAANWLSSSFGGMKWPARPANRCAIRSWLPLRNTKATSSCPAARILR